MKKLQLRHWTFIGLALAVLITMLINIEPNLEVSAETHHLFEYIDSLPPESILMVSFDHEASALPEIRPLAHAFLRHAFSKGHRLIGVAFMAEGTAIGYRLMDQVAKEYGKSYGIDYTYLGFKPQYIAAILSMGESIKETFPKDYLGNDYDSLPILRNVKNYSGISAVFSIADGNLVTHWIEYGRARYNINVCALVSAVMVTSYDPYINSGQLKGMIGGLRGAAEYEKLLKIGGAGKRGMLAQVTSHVYIIFLILIGNIIYIVQRRQKGRG